MQNFAVFTPHYPGVRAPVSPPLIASWIEQLSPLLSHLFGGPRGLWSVQCWRSIVTRAPGDLAPIQRLPHVDGVDPDQIALMLYLHRTGHGGTAFFRHRSTGLESLTAETYPTYKSRLETEVAETGLPRAAYVSDGAPYFERVHMAEGIFNRAVIYRGNIFHSGVIDCDHPLPNDPRTGRYTINAFLRPPQDAALATGPDFATRTP